MDWNGTERQLQCSRTIKFALNVNQKRQNVRRSRYHEFVIIVIRDFIVVIVIVIIVMSPLLSLLFRGANRSLSLSLPLSHTHTHTRKHRECALLQLYRCICDTYSASGNGHTEREKKMEKSESNERDPKRIAHVRPVNTNWWSSVGRWTTRNATSPGVASLGSNLIIMDRKFSDVCSIPPLLAPQWNW